MFPALLAALAYACLASGMPRAGGSYVYASRSIHAYLGFVASFSQWFGLAMAMGAVAYVLVPFFRDIATALDLSQLAATLESGPVRVTLALGFLLGSHHPELDRYQHLSESDGQSHVSHVRGRFGGDTGWILLQPRRLRRRSRRAGKG